MLCTLFDAVGDCIGNGWGCELHVRRLHNGLASGGAVEGNKLVQHGVGCFALGAMVDNDHPNWRLH